MKYLFTLMLGLLLLGLQTASACGDSYAHGDLKISQPYTRTTPPSAPVAGGFMTITNNGKESDTLLGGSVDFAEVVEIHEMPMIDGVMKMRQLPDGLKIPAGETVELKPGGYHMMFIKLSEQMKEDDKHKATLNFAKAGEIEVEFVVKDISKMLEDKGHKMDHSGDKQEHNKHSKEKSE